ncbi:MAG TPA: hypothetical protein VML96_11785 [Egibacteraceae bacterium]|nr:hypothetical protein [Egibacteraceae bacterium]
MPDPVLAALQELAGRRAVARLHAREPWLWSDDAGHQAVIADRLGWLDVAADDGSRAGELRAISERALQDGLDRVVLAGMGGSSLAPEVFARVFGAQPDGAMLSVLDSTHPVAVTAALDDAPLERTLVVVSSKSGGTEETAAFAARAASLVPSPAHLFAVTDAGSTLAAQAEDGGWRGRLLNPGDIGGRYSALSYFGMLPAALLGIDTAVLWHRSGHMLERCRSSEAGNPGAELAAFMGGLARRGRDKLTLLADPDLEPLGDWIEQLVAESTGKQGLGIVPVVGEPIGPPEIYGADRAFVEIRLDGQPVAGAAAIAAAGHPLLVVDLADRFDLAAEFVRWEVATALAGVLLGVNPFDEPNVAESKSNTRAVLDDVVAGGALADPEDGDLSQLLAGVGPGDYVSLQAYLPPSGEALEVFSRIRALIRERTGAATTFGWGPRFLHSTGQLHKGGPSSLVALQVVDSPSGGPDIPGRPYDFATLVRAQAVGDLRSLRQHGLRAAQMSAADPFDLEPVAQQIATALS